MSLQKFDGSGITPFMRAAVDKDVTVLLRLICGKDHEEVATELLKRDHKGRSALDWARSSRNYLAVTVIMKVVSSYIQNLRISTRSTLQSLHDQIVRENKRKNLVLIRDIRNGNTTEALAVLAANDLVREEVESLGEKYFVDIPWANGYTPLMLACGLGLSDVVSQLVELKCPINQANRFGHSALTLAVCSGHSDVVSYLLFEGADVYQQTLEGRTALHYACFYKKAKMVRIIMDYLLEQFATFRIEEHSLVDFDPSRWTDYGKKLTMLLDMKDKDGQKAIDLLDSDHNVAKDDSLLIQGADNTGTEEDDLISELSLDYQDADAVSAADRLPAEDELSGSVGFSQQTDNMHALGLHNVYSVASALPLDEEVALIRDCLAGILVKVAAWEEYAKKEMELTVEIPCALQCGAIIKREDMMTHIRDNCILRTVQCRQCHKIVVLSQVQYHDRTACVQRTVGCVNAFQGCGCLLTPSYMEQHLKFHCDYRFSMCRQYCGTQIPFKFLDMHEQFHCSQRQIQCDQCKEPMLAHEYANHLTSKCSLRQIKCSVGCGVSFFAKDIIHHENNECSKFCSNSPCKMKIGPPSRLRYHEVHECQFRKLNCKYNCGENTFKRDIDYHQTHLCPATPSYCTLGCGVLLCRSTLMEHCDKSCPERLVRCPSNYVNRRIVVRAEGQAREGVVLRYRCVEVEQRNARDVPCHELYVRFNDGHEWINLITANIVLHKSNNDKKANVKTADNFSCGLLVFSDLTHHLQYECSHRTVIIETDATSGTYGHSTKVVQFKNAVASSQSMVSLTEQAKTLGTGNGFIDCAHCGESLPAVDIQEHVLLACPEVDALCHIGCGKYVKRKLMTKHTEHECPKRIVICVQCGSNELWAEEIDDHKISKCSHRVVPCQFECGISHLLAHQEPDHLNIHCPNRQIQCKCGLSVLQKDLPSHNQFHCNVRPMLCPQGCGEIMSLNDRDNHINFFCKQRFLFRFAKTVECKNGCGAMLQRRELLHHVTYECEKRLVECPQLCGSAVQLDRLQEHLVTCPQRVICCEPGMKCCERPLHCWFYKGVRYYDNPNGLDPYEEEKSIQGTAKSQGLMSRKSTAKTVVSETQSIQSEHTSVYFEGIAMKFRENIRMLVCEKHGMNAIMASIRLDDFILAEYLIKQVEESGDIDEENVYGDTALTLACRMGKLDFVRLLVQHGADLNKETFNGRTALIEAIKCPVEDLPMIEYLVKEGCMVTYKTAKHRRTALDWARRYAASEISLYDEKRHFALKAALGLGQVAELTEFSDKIPEKLDIPEEDLPMELTQEQRRLMGRPKTVRVLELASVVQQQCNIMFQKIAIGDTDYIISIIKDGDFFDPLNEEKAYEQMKKNVALADESDEEIVKVQKRMHGLSDKVDRLQAHYKDCLDRLKAAEDFVEDLFSREQAVDKTMNNAFSAYDKLAAKMTVVELEEIVRVKNPPNSLLVALYAYAIVFNLAPIDEAASMTLDSILESKSNWLSAVSASMQSSPEALRLLQNYSRARLHYERHQSLFSACQTLLIVFKFLSNNNSKGMSSSLSPPRTAQGFSSPPSTPSSPNRSKAPTLADYIFLAARTDDGSEGGNGVTRGNDVTGSPAKGKDTANMGGMSSMKSTKRDKIEDYEWDSDAEDPEGGGRWEKGEWMSVSRRRADWWNPSDNGEGNSVKEKIRKEKLVVLTTDVIETEKQKTLQEIEKKLSLSHLPSTLELMEEDKIENVVKPLTAAIGDGSPSRNRSRTQSRASSPDKPGSVKGSRREKSRAKSKNKKSRKKATDTSGDGEDNTVNFVTGHADDVGQHFVSCIVNLLSAIVTFGSNYPVLLERRIETRSAVVVVDGIKEELENALVAYNDQFSHRAGLEQEYIKQLKKSRFHHEKVTLYTNKVRVSRLFNYVCVNGHTAISYAASYGNYALVEEMLSRGGSVGYTAEALIEVVKFIQMSYRIYRMTLKAKASLKRADDDDAGAPTKPSEKKEENKPVDEGEDNVKEALDPLQAFTSSRAHYLNLVREIELMKERRRKILSIVVFNRQKIRLPIPEALYMGHWEIVHRIYERRLWHAYFTNTFTFPLPHVPYLRQFEYMYSHEKRSVLDVMTHAITHVASGIYTSKEGWLPPGHMKEPFGEMIIEISKILTKMSEKNTKAKNAKHRFRIIKNSKKNMLIYEQQLVKLIYQRKFREAIALVTDRGLNVDLETTDGQTLLIAASDENVHALNHKHILNDELKPVLSVEYLLDRYSFRPNINYETKGGLTALLRACLLGREDIVVALLNRGANINHKNVHGMTVLHYSAYCGHSHIVRLLTERNIDLAATDRQNRTAYQLAEEQNFIDIMMLLSQRATGNLGKLAYTRGDINNFFSCPLGCGARLMNYMMEPHMAMECECRYVPCPNGCDDARIMKKEVEKHVVEQCVHRLLDCRDCGVAVAFSDMRNHLYKDCSWRMVPCLNEGCDKQMAFKDLDLHLRICPQKLVPCPLMCNIFLPEIRMDNHVTNECLNRRVPCPLKCRNAIICKLLEDHMKSICSRREVSCPLCEARVEKQYLEKHVREECGNRDIPCPNDCKQLLPLSSITEHLLNACSLRYVPCSLDCGVEVQAAFLESHLQSKCINRLIPCKYRCLEDENVPADQQQVNRFTEKLIHLHEQYDCINRPLRCALCTADMLSRQRLRHNLEECGKRIVRCPHKPQGCLKELPHDKLAHHLALQCKYRDILCPLGCQQYLTSLKKLSHVQDDCLYRYIPCPLGCKEQVKVKDVMGHIQNDCVRRHVTHVCYTSRDKEKKREKREEAATRASAGDLNSMLSSMSVREVGSDAFRESKKVKMRKEETLRVHKVRSELRMSAELRSKLIQAVQSSSGAKLVANNM